MRECWRYEGVRSYKESSGESTGAMARRAAVADGCIASAVRTAAIIVVGLQARGEAASDDKQQRHGD